jgi:hypothetical protein
MSFSETEIYDPLQTTQSYVAGGHRLLPCKVVCRGNWLEDATCSMIINRTYVERLLWMLG